MVELGEEGAGAGEEWEPSTGSSQGTGLPLSVAMRS